MNKLNCLIIDDSEDIQISLNDILSRYSFIKTYSAQSLKEAINKLKDLNIDLILLDIRLKDENGLDIIRVKNNFPPVIIISNYPEYAVETWLYDQVVDYILKPVQETRLMRAIFRAININPSARILEPKNFIYLKYMGKMVRFNYDQIDYIEAAGIKSKVYYNGIFKLVNEPISVIEKSLPVSHFKRIHRSFIVNLSKVSSIQNKSVEIGSIKLPLGLLYKTELEKFFILPV